MLFNQQKTHFSRLIWSYVTCSARKMLISSIFKVVYRWWLDYITGEIITFLDYTIASNTRSHPTHDRIQRLVLIFLATDADPRCNFGSTEKPTINIVYTLKVCRHETIIPYPSRKHCCEIKYSLSSIRLTLKSFFF